MGTMLIEALRSHARTQPASVAFSGISEVTYAVALDAVRRLASHITRSGWQRLALLMENSPEWPLIDLATQLAGVTLIPLPLFFSDQQLQHALNDAGVEAVLTDHAQRIRPLCGDAIEERLPVTDRLSIDLLILSNPRPVSLEGIARVTYTSGTTGEPKGVCLQQKTIDRVARSLSEASGASADDHHLSLLPLSTLLENIVAVYLPLLTGARCHLPAPASSGIILLEGGLSMAQTMRFVAVGGASLADGLRLRAEALGIPLYQGYGLSECGSVVTLNTMQNSRPGSVGRPLPHLQVRIALDGEIEVKGAGFAGYLGSRADGNEWLASGDLGRIDDDGYLYLTGRKRNLMITAYGRNLSPEWVEAELESQPAIARAALFGDGRPWNCALIVARGDLNEVALAIDSANRRLPEYAQIRHWLPADEPFTLANGELTANGRIRRVVIDARYGQRIDELYRSRHSSAPASKMKQVVQKPLCVHG
jgi:long-chain acyl-CoA synthetase